MRKSILIAALAMIQTSTVLAAQGNALPFFGTVSTLTSKSGETLYVVGWVLIVIGTVGGAKANAAELNDINSDATIYNPDQSTNAPQMLSAKVTDILRATEMDAMIATRTPQLAQGLRIAEFATSMGVTADRLGHLVISGKSLADSKLNGQTFAAQHVQVSTDDVARVSGPLTDVELQVVSNYLKLRNIDVE